MAYTVNLRQLQCVALLQKAGLSPSGAAACVGNFVMESGPALVTAFRTGNLDHGSQGLAQWRGARLDAYRAFVVAKHPDFESSAQLQPWLNRIDYQCEFVILELTKDYAMLYRKLCIGGDVGALAADVCWQYERPNRTLAHIADRIGWAGAIAAAIPSMVRTKPADLSTSLLMHAQRHDAQARTGATMTCSGIALSLIIAAAHAVPTMDWRLSLCLGALMFVTLGGLAIAIVHAHASANIRAAMPNVDNAVPRANGNIAPDPHPKPVDATGTNVSNDSLAKLSEAKAVQQAMLPQAPVQPVKS